MAKTIGLTFPKEKKSKEKKADGAEEKKSKEKKADGAEEKKSEK